MNDVDDETLALLMKQLEIVKRSASRVVDEKD